MRVEDHIDWSKLSISEDHLMAALEKGGDVILAESNKLAPKVSGDLIASGAVKPNRGGNMTVGIEYSSVYAHWIHEHLWFHHPHGGQAKFLESAMMTKGSDALNAIAGAIKL